MAKKTKHVVRTYDNPELGIEYPDGRTIKLFALKENESIPNHLSTNYDHHWTGPALVYEDSCPQRRICDELNVNDEATWKWIGMLIQNGLQGGAVLTSPVQKVKLEDSLSNPER